MRTSDLGTDIMYVGVELRSSQIYSDVAISFLLCMVLRKAPHLTVTSSGSALALKQHFNSFKIIGFLGYYSLQRRKAFNSPAVDCTE